MEQNFVSAGVIDVKKKKRKAYFEDKLQQAKDDYEASKRKRELEKHRGDKNWMLPSLTSKIDEDIGNSKHKKKKQKKKSKKKKKKKNSQQENQSSSNDEVSSDEWEEIDKHTITPTVTSSNNSVLSSQATNISVINDASMNEENISKQNKNRDRDEWMLSSSMFDIASKQTSSRENKTKNMKEEKRRKEEEEKKLVQNSRELNPYWSNNGNGIPDDRKTTTKTVAEPTASNKIGDGGRSWIEKAYERAVQQSKDEGVSLEQIVKNRWGSMDKLQALMKMSSNNSSSTKTSGWRKDKEIDSAASENKVLRKSLNTRKENHANELSSTNIATNIVSPDMSGNIVSPDVSSTESESEEEVANVLSEKEKNEISAKIIRAEIMGQEELCEKLKARLNAPTKAVKKRSKPTKVNDEEEIASDGEEILTRADKHGNLYPIKLKTEVQQLNQKQRIRKKIVSTHDEDGQRVRYFEDDDNVNLKTLVEQERLTTSSDHLAMMSRLASKHLGKSQGDDYTLDDMYIQASATKGSNRMEEKRLKEKAVEEHKQREQQLSSCRFCFGNPKLSKHLIIAMGRKVYLALPLNSSLTEGHCLILPMHHVIGQTFFDEDITQEVKQFKKTLTRMFSDKEEDVIFVETCKYIRHQNHCVIECIPVPKEIGDMAPIYFKKALMECESEWAQNKKVVEIRSSGGVEKALPKGLPYFAVEFGIDGGYAHVLEEEESFQSYFGKEIIGGMLDIEPRLWRKPPKESFERHKKKVLKFSECWKNYDFTN